MCWMDRWMAAGAQQSNARMHMLKAFVILNIFVILV